jgi:nicotinamidase-related amidase
MIDNRAQQKALLVVDMLNDFVLEGAPLRIPAASDIIAAIKRRIGNARNRGIPVVHICDAHDPDDREFEVWPPHAVAGTRGAEVVDELKPAAGDIRVAKKRFSGFYQSELDEALSRLGASHLMVTAGITVSPCFGTLLPPWTPSPMPLPSSRWRRFLAQRLYDLSGKTNGKAQISYRQ